MERRRQERFAQIVPWLKTDYQKAYEVHLTHPTMVNSMSTVLKNAILNMADPRAHVKHFHHDKSRKAALLIRNVMRDGEENENYAALQSVLDELVGDDEEHEQLLEKLGVHLWRVLRSWNQPIHYFYQPIIIHRNHIQYRNQILEINSIISGIMPWSFDEINLIKQVSPQAPLGVTRHKRIQIN